MTKKNSISFGNKSYELRELTLGELQKISEELVTFGDELTPQQRHTRLWEIRRRVIALSLGARYPELSYEGQEEIVCNLNEYNEAYEALLVFHGFHKQGSEKDAGVGEAAAGAAP